MKNRIFIFLSFIFVVVIISCKDQTIKNKRNNSNNEKILKDSVNVSDEKKHEIINNRSSDWILHWENADKKTQLLNNPKIHKRIKDCLRDSTIIVLTSFMNDEYDFGKKIKSVGDINGDKKNDSIMVIPELFITKENSYENGSSIIFTDPTIPRIRVNVTCLDVDYIFPVGDIDDDGIKELGKYYSSCASRYKNLELIRLKHGKWVLQGEVLFDTWFDKPNKEKRIKITGKNKFKMLEVKGIGKENIRSEKWIEFVMK